MTVRRGAVCNTDHHLVVAKVKLWRDRQRSGAVSEARRARMRRYDVGKLLSKDEEGQEVRDKYQQEVLE